MVTQWQQIIEILIVKYQNSQDANKSLSYFDATSIYFFSKITFFLKWGLSQWGSTEHKTWLSLYLKLNILKHKLMSFQNTYRQCSIKSLHHYVRRAVRIAIQQIVNNSGGKLSKTKHLYPYQLLHQTKWVIFQYSNSYSMFTMKTLYHFYRI